MELQFVWIKTGWCSSTGSSFKPEKWGFNVNSGLIFETSDDDLVGIKSKHDGGLHEFYGHIGNGNAVCLVQNGLSAFIGYVLYTFCLLNMHSTKYNCSLKINTLFYTFYEKPSWNPLHLSLPSWLTLLATFVASGIVTDAGSMRGLKASKAHF